MKDLTEVVFILDRSGSMSGLEKDTIGGFNAMIEQQKEKEGDVIVSTILFDHDYKILHDRMPIHKIEPLTKKDYYVGGTTALLDAVGRTIHHIGSLHKHLPREIRPSRTLFIITTDGMENASRKYTSDRVKEMIEHQKEKYGWEFLFIGANIDAVETAARYGISKDRAVNYNSDELGTKILYETVSKAVYNVRACAPLSADWSKDIDKDYKSRNKKSR